MSNTAHTADRTARIHLDSAWEAKMVADKLRNTTECDAQWATAKSDGCYLTMENVNDFYLRRCANSCL